MHASNRSKASNKHIWQAVRTGKRPTRLVIPLQGVGYKSALPRLLQRTATFYKIRNSEQLFSAAGQIYSDPREQPLGRKHRQAVVADNDQILSSVCVLDLFLTNC